MNTVTQSSRWLTYVAVGAALCTTGVAVTYRPRQPNEATRKIPPTVEVAADDHAMGNADAPVTIVVYSDFECPYCARFARDTMPGIETRYVEQGIVRLIFRHYPLDTIHVFATRASEAAECAGQQEKFWAMHDTLFVNQKRLDERSLRTYADRIGLDKAKFGHCMGGDAVPTIEKHRVMARASDVNATPTVLVGKRSAANQLHVIARFDGMVTMTELAEVVVNASGTR